MTAAEVLAGARFVDGLLVDQRSGNWLERPEPTAAAPLTTSPTVVSLVAREHPRLLHG